MESTKAQYDCNMSMIHSLDRQLEQIRPEIEALLQNQLDYYYELLNVGADVRNMGLSWVIKTIWYLGGKIHMQRFPKALDSDSIKYLLEISRMDLERDKVAKKLHEVAVENRRTKLSEVRCVVQRSDRGEPERHYALKQEDRTQDEQEAFLQEQLRRVILRLKELRKEEVARLTKIFLHEELRKKSFTNDMYKILCMLLGTHRN